MAGFDSEDNYKPIRYKKSKIKAFFKTFFDTVYAPANHNHQNVYEAANANIQSHIGDEDIHVTSTEKSTWSGKQDALTFSTNIETDKASTTKVSAIKTFYDWAVGKFIDLTKIVTSWNATNIKHKHSFGEISKR